MALESTKEYVQILYQEPMYWYEDITNKLTGRWKIYTVNGKSTLYLEKKGLFKQWLSEEYLYIDYVEETIFKC